MPKIIKHDRVVDDAWQVLRLEAEDTAAAVALPTTPTLFPLAVWLARRDELQGRQASAGVWLESGEQPEALAGQLDQLPIVAINFPKFADGRGYSTARLLRERYGYVGEIRAIGDVLRDQLFFMKRCGFDAYAVRADKDIEAACAGLRDFSATYQAAADQPLPLFRRRAAEAVGGLQG